ncbi:MAG: PAS domain S-box protein [Deltaproteobacteria bacterium]|nr:PAS domain S-box protein [Deltaproteobacteria bacterium]
MEEKVTKHYQPVQNTIDISRNGFIVIEKDGTIVSFSESAKDMFGYSRSDLIGKNLSRLFLEDDRKYLYQNILNLTTQSNSFEGELKMCRKDKSCFFAYINTCLYHDVEKGIELIMIVIQDIDELKLLAKKYNESKRIFDIVRMADSVAHEIRNPLMTVGGFVRRLYDKCEKSDVTDEYYSHISEGIERLEKIVKNVESFSKIPRPSMVLGKLSDVLRETLLIAEKRREKKGIVLDIDIDNVKDLELFLDNDLMVQALTVIMDNAIDVLSEGDRIAISSGIKDECAVLTIKDNGCGIAEIDLPYIFDPFFTRKNEGIGLNLAMTRRIIEDHGGRVTVESTQEVGTKFYVFLPIEQRRKIRLEMV